MNNIEIALEETMYEMIFSDIPKTNYKIRRSFDRRMKKMIRSYLADNTLDKSVHKSKKRWRYIIIIAVTLVLTITAAAVVCYNNITLEKHDTFSLLHIEDTEKAPENINVSFPVKFGVIADIKNMETLFSCFYKKLNGGKTVNGADYCIAVPTDVTEVEKRAFYDVILDAKLKAKNITVVEKPIPDAVGMGIDVQSPNGHMIVDIGSDTTEISVISLGGTVVSTSIKVAGDDFDEALVRYMRKKHNLLIGERTAEEIKINIGAAYRRPELVTMEVRGRNLVTGLPKTIVVTSDETLEALREPAMQIVDAVHNVLERTPPELAADIFDRGIVLTGGGSLISGLDALIEEKTGITTMIAEEPLTAVAIGTGKFIEFAHGGKGAEK